MYNLDFRIQLSMIFLLGYKKYEKDNDFIDLLNSIETPEQLEELVKTNERVKELFDKTQNQLKEKYE